MTVANIVIFFIVFDVIDGFQFYSAVYDPQLKLFRFLTREFNPIINIKEKLTRETQTENPTRLQKLSCGVVFLLNDSNNESDDIYYKAGKSDFVTCR